MAPADRDAARTAGWPAGAQAPPAGADERPGDAERPHLDEPFLDALPRREDVPRAPADEEKPP